MIDNIKSIFENINTRISAPLFGCFFISWCFSNYPIILMLLSGHSVIEKVSYIDSYIGYDLRLFTFRLFIFPALITFFYFYLYPYVEIKIYRKHLENIRHRNNEKKSVEGLELLSKEESIEIRRYTDEMVNKYEELINEKTDEIETYKGLYESAAQEVREERAIKEKEASRRHIPGLECTFGVIRSHDEYSNMSLAEAMVLGYVIGNQNNNSLFDLIENMKDFPDTEIKRTVRLLEDSEFIETFSKTLNGDFRMKLSKNGRLFEKIFSVY